MLGDGAWPLGGPPPWRDVNYVGHNGPSLLLWRPLPPNEVGAPPTTSTPCCSDPLASSSPLCLVMGGLHRSWGPPPISCFRPRTKVVRSCSGGDPPSVASVSVADPSNSAPLHPELSSVLSFSSVPPRSTPPLIRSSLPGGDPILFLCSPGPLLPPSSASLPPARHLYSLLCFPLQHLLPVALILLPPPTRCVL